MVHWKELVIEINVELSHGEVKWVAISFTYVL